MNGNVDALKAKILIDHMFLENLFEQQNFKPTIEKRIRDHLGSTRRNFSSCFAKDLDDAMENLNRVLASEAED